MSIDAFTRAVTIFAVGFLLLNAVLLFMVDHVVWGIVFSVAAVLAVIGWFWYRRALREVAQARKDMKREVESLRDLLNTHRRN